VSRLDELLLATPYPALEEQLERGAPLMLGARNVAAEVLALIHSIGHSPKGSHPDEQGPRDRTWHAERQNWIREVERLREKVRASQASGFALGRDAALEEAAKFIEGTTTDRFTPAAIARGIRALKAKPEASET